MRIHTLSCLNTTSRIGKKTGRVEDALGHETVNLWTKRTLKGGFHARFETSTEVFVFLDADLLRFTHTINSRQNDRPRNFAYSDIVYSAQINFSLPPQGLFEGPPTTDKLRRICKQSILLARALEHKSVKIQLHLKLPHLATFVCDHLQRITHAHPAHWIRYTPPVDTHVVFCVHARAGGDEMLVRDKVHT